ncbi:hypothetical protein KSZ_23680 [Dictyobacter formicarum]|uniref:Tn3 transposase DDE domain-containing protein n=1 Tax=Dictyobacter formicarum TaxID=2778368 RepID=A0ABQ3VDZ2_9CHLR|nr:hypothetical protein KSZ_23680 [Dictyobacter formicarum]
MLSRKITWLTGSLKYVSVDAWERTLDFLKKLYAVRKNVEAVLSRIGNGIENLVYKHAWAGKNVERYIVAAQEIEKDRYKLFA